MDIALRECNYNAGIIKLFIDRQVQSTLHFAPKGRSRSYAGIHVAMVGVRSLFAPMFGYTMLKEVGFQAACLTAATLVLCGSALLLLFVPREAPAA